VFAHGVEEVLVEVLNAILIVTVQQIRCFTAVYCTVQTVLHYSDTRLFVGIQKCHFEISAFHVFISRASNTGMGDLIDQQSNRRFCIPIFDLKKVA
jgi:hypothetical protein